jgi:hypothetical protein
MSTSSSSDGDSIQVRIETISQLFHSLDPSPFREKDLDKNAEEFIVNWAQELPAGTPVMRLPEAEVFFGYRAQVTGYELRELFRIVRRSLVVGIAVSITVGQTVAASLDPRP